MSSVGSEEASQSAGSESYDDEEQEQLHEITDAQIMPADAEKGQLLSMFDALRRESTFCDVAFLCQGKLYRAHRVVVSGWSRWLRTLLLQGRQEEVMTVDMFDADAFESVLMYMYGHPLTVTVLGAEKTLKVVRRLELHGLEQSMWIFLMGAIDSNNCNNLHELADRYDCPPLKLAAWRFIQRQHSRVDSHREEILAQTVHNNKGNGLTGPGESAFYRNVTMQEKMESERSLEDAIRDMPHVLHSHGRRERRLKRTKENGESGGEAEDKEVDDEYSDSASSSDGSDSDENAFMESPDKNLSSYDYVHAWSKRLDHMYRACTVDPNDASAGEAAMSNAHNRTILVGSRIRSGHEHSPVSSPGRDRGSTNAGASVGGGGGGHSPKGRAPESSMLTPGDIDWGSELKAFYLGINMPEKLPFIDEILVANRGREEQMISHLMIKYKRVIPTALAHHLDTLQGFLEAHSENPFSGSRR